MAWRRCLALPGHSMVKSNGVLAETDDQRGACRKGTQLAAKPRDSMIEDYYSNFSDQDPLSVPRLQLNRAKIATLAAYRAQRSVEEIARYQNLHRPL
uniref:Homeobox domain-containing protein n=1 Tax=Globodera pallida TaxID=36090 RepID=A0A183CSZ1_GLOPA